MPDAATRPRFALLRAIRRDIRNEEPTWMGDLGSWEWGAGFFKGFGIGFTIRSDEFDVTFGPFAIGGIRRGR